MVSRRTPWWASVALLVLAALWIMASCTDILGIDTLYDTNLCDDGRSRWEGCGDGLCFVLVDQCDEKGRYVQCTGDESQKQAVEKCDGLDNDCDGLVDEDSTIEGCHCNEGDSKPCYTGTAATRNWFHNKGLCHEGTQDCEAAHHTYGPCRDVNLPKEETEDGFDNDCDGEIDEDIDCEDGRVQLCFGGTEERMNKGPCRQGTQSCTAGKWGPCVSQILPSPEECDGLDNDCDGDVDNLDAGDNPCVCVGAGEVCYLEQHKDTPCHLGVIRCEPGSLIPKCKPNVQPGSVQENCNGIDDNCDGITDNGHFCCKGDGKESGNETDIDCGGTCDTKCEDGKGCKVGGDCVSGNCVNDTCISPTCSDGVRNGGESDTDCGIVCVNKCLVGHSCELDADCVSNLCKPANKKCIQKTPGEACITSVECASGYCVDGVCCDTACNGVCEACTKQKKGGGLNGACEPVADNTDPDGDCDENLPSSCQLTGVCKAGACARHPQGTVCQAAVCTGLSTLDQADICDGNGACTPVLEQDCGAYACIGNACKSTCMNDGGCAPGHFCEAPQCKPKKPLGQSCARAGQCDSSYCVDRVCCDSDCGGKCNACNLQGQLGTCLYIPVNQDPANECDTSCDGIGACQKVNGLSCSVNGQCESGNCVDGVCCRTQCNGTCQACSAALKGGGFDGLCGWIAAGTDPDDDCVQEPVSTCGTTGVCNGAGACQQWPAGAACGAALCIGPATLAKQDTCAHGLCQDGGAQDCTPYACDGTQSNANCSADTECAPGHKCTSNKCVQQP